MRTGKGASEVRVPVTGSWDFGMDGWDWVYLILSCGLDGCAPSGFWFLVSHGDVFMECKISA